MIQLPIKPTHQISLGLLLYGYAVLLSGAYTFGFWRPFGFNPFPYLTTHDVITAPLSNLLVLLAPFILLMPLGVFDQSERSKDPKLFRIMLYTHWLLYFSVLLEAVNLIYRDGINYSDERRVLAMTGLMTLISFGLYGRSKREPTQRYFPLLCVVFAQLAIVIVGGYQSGKLFGAQSALTNKGLNAYALSEPTRCDPARTSQWLYLERHGQHAFFYNRGTRALCILDNSDLQLRPVKIEIERIAP